MRRISPPNTLCAKLCSTRTSFEDLCICTSCKVRRKLSFVDGAHWVPTSSGNCKLHALTTIIVVSCNDLEPVCFEICEMKITRLQSVPVWTPAEEKYVDFWARFSTKRHQHRTTRLVSTVSPDWVSQELVTAQWSHQRCTCNTWNKRTALASRCIVSDD